MDTMKNPKPDLATGGESVDGQWIGPTVFFLWPVGLYLLWKQFPLFILFFVPAGAYLLYKHPELSQHKRWWWSGGVWSFLFFLMAIWVDKQPSTDKAELVKPGPTTTADAAKRPSQDQTNPPAQSFKNPEVENHEKLKAWNAFVQRYDNPPSTHGDMSYKELQAQTKKVADWANETGRLRDEFVAISFDGSKNIADAKAILDSYKDYCNRTKSPSEILEAEMGRILNQYYNR